MKRMEWNGRGCVHLDADLFFCLPPTSSKFPSNSPPFPHLHQREMNQLIGPGLDGGSVRGQCHLAASGVIPPHPHIKIRNGDATIIWNQSPRSAETATTTIATTAAATDAGDDVTESLTSQASPIQWITHWYQLVCVCECQSINELMKRKKKKERKREREKERKREREKSLCVTSVTSRPGN